MRRLLDRIIFLWSSVRVSLLYDTDRALIAFCDAQLCQIGVAEVKGGRDVEQRDVVEWILDWEQIVIQMRDAVLTS